MLTKTCRQVPPINEPNNLRIICNRAHILCSLVDISKIGVDRRIQVSTSKYQLSTTKLSRSLYEETILLIVCVCVCVCSVDNSICCAAQPFKPSTMPILLNNVFISIDMNM